MSAPSPTPAREPDFLRRHVDTYYRERVEKTWHGGHILHGRTPDPGGVLMMSNDYLAIAGHPRIVAAQTRALNKEPAGAVMSGVYLHGDTPHARLEVRLAALVGTEAAVLTQSGYAANTGLLQAIAAPGTPVYLDRLAHASLWEGAHSAQARCIVFRHNDIEHLARRIRRHGPGIVVVDALYSTCGSLAPLTDLVALAERQGCAIVVDESHSLGTFGDRGQGRVASLGLSERVHFVTASLAKAFAARAGLVAGSRRLMQFLPYNARPAIFSSALLAHEIAGLNATLDVIRAARDRRARLHRNTAQLRERLESLGYNLELCEAQILSLEAGTEQRTLVLRDALEARGVFGSVFCAPATAKNRALIRLSVNAGLTQRQIDHVVRVCQEIREAVALGDWSSTRRKCAS